MKDLQIFENEQFGEVRVIDKDGAPWFVAKDVARVLEMRDSDRVTRLLDEDEKVHIKWVPLEVCRTSL